MLLRFLYSYYTLMHTNTDRPTGSAHGTWRSVKKGAETANSVQTSSWETGCCTGLCARGRGIRQDASWTTSLYTSRARKSSLAHEPGSQDCASVKDLNTHSTHWVHSTQMMSAHTHTHTPPTSLKKRLLYLRARRHDRTVFKRITEWRETAGLFYMLQICLFFSVKYYDVFI